MFPGKLMLTVEDVARVLGLPDGRAGREAVSAALRNGDVLPGLRKSHRALARSNGFAREMVGWSERSARNSAAPAGVTVRDAWEQYRASRPLPHLGYSRFRRQVRARFGKVYIVSSPGSGGVGSANGSWVVISTGIARWFAGAFVACTRFHIAAFAARPLVREQAVALLLGAKSAGLQFRTACRGLSERSGRTSRFGVAPAASEQSAGTADRNGWVGVELGAGRVRREGLAGPKRRRRRRSRTSCAPS
jgi:hypothetical protein